MSRPTPGAEPDAPGTPDPAGSGTPDPAGPARLVLGAADAPVTLTEFGDLECPYCRAAEPVLRAVVEESDGEVRLVWRHFPLFQVHPHALVAALAAEAAAERGLFWPVQRRLLGQQDRLAEPDLRAVAQDLGIDPQSAAGPGAQRFAGLVEQDYLAGLELGVAGTPTLFVGRLRYAGPWEVEPLRAAVRDAAAGRRSARPLPVRSGPGGDGSDRCGA